MYMFEGMLEVVARVLEFLFFHKICRLIDTSLKKTVQRVSKSKIPTPSGHALDGKIVRLFYDDTFKSYFRRLTYSPDGMLLLVPSGIIEHQESAEKIVNCIHIFSRHTLREPIAVLPSHEEVTNAVRCCPMYFKLRKEGPSSMMDLPYRMVFAVATDKSVMIYDTQQISPIAVISNIHYTRVTDIAWSSDGRILIASSSDGYCSIIHFDEGELGETYEKAPEIVEPKKNEVRQDTKETKSLLDTTLDQSTNAIDIDISQEKSKEILSSEKEMQSPKENNTGKKITPLKENKNDTEMKSPKKNEEEKISASEIKQKENNDNTNNASADDEDDFHLVLEDTITDTDKLKATPPKTKESEKPATPIAARTPRRVSLITLSSPKGKKL
ncbi:chromatin assembly factor 1 subunit B-like [Copidosoma floridanum]|uniref:chromatin assembly factor 1 subunit B-like n=1 Tax=Copidosoma floridanum TaxID=29053 RepID=UPI000C6FC666|nr:chromatin assembly factor 1 subunit B-like [Copidosoma floridanum]